MMPASTKSPARWFSTALAVLVVSVGAACDGAPQAPGDGDNVQIDLAPFFSGFSSSKTPCSEADFIRLWVRDVASDAIVFRDSAGVPPCTATFEVTVPGGDTKFIALVTGDGRPLLADTFTLNIQDDGWTAPVALQPISALLVSLDTSADTTGIADTLSYTYTVSTEESGASDPIPIVAGTTDTFLALSAGEATIELFGAESCNVGPENPILADIPVDSVRVDSVTFDVDCNNVSSPTGTVRVITSTTGNGGPDPYVLVVASDTLLVGRNDTVSVPGVPVGSQTVELVNAVGCSITPSNPQSATVVEGATTDVVFTVDATLPCGTGVFGAIEVVTVTAGSGGPSGYDFTVDGGLSMGIGTNASVIVDSVLVGSHQVELLNFASCSVSPDSIQSVSVAADDTVQVTFNVDCNGSGLGSVGVITSTTGPDPGDYEYLLLPEAVGTIASNDTLIVDNLAPGPRSVAIINTDPCLVTSANPDTVTVTAGDTVFVTFDVECSPQIEVRTTTVGPDVDPDGYTVTVVDSAQSQPIGVNDSVVFANLSSGSYTVQLSGVASNCIVVFGSTRTAVVGTIGTTTVQFLVECFAQTSLASDSARSERAPEAFVDEPRHPASRSRRSS